MDTVQNYLSYFTEALITHKVLRYDLKGKRHLELHEKYYLNEIGIRHALLGYREADIGGILENIVFLELKRRGYSVSIGKFGDREVDFIATRKTKKSTFRSPICWHPQTPLNGNLAYCKASRTTTRKWFSASTAHSAKISKAFAAST